MSEREFQVFLRLAKGETIGHMADSMSLSVKTVSTYRTRVMEKMGASSLAHLVRMVLDLEESAGQGATKSDSAS